MNIVDAIVAVLLLAPLLYAAYWFHSRNRVTGDVADQAICDLTERSRLDAAEHGSKVVL